MEKGEGPELAQLYQVRAYPTLLFISAAGELVHRKAGYMVAEEFISLGEEANDPSRTLSGMDAKFADGNREPDFLRQYTEASFNAANGGHSIVASEYLNTQKDWETEENMQFIFQYIDNADSKAFDYIIKNRKQFEDYFGKPMVTQKVHGLIYS
jgi:hypothetical protein